MKIKISKSQWLKLGAEAGWTDYSDLYYYQVLMIKLDKLPLPAAEGPRALAVG